MNKIHVMVGNIGTGKSSTVNALRVVLRPYSYILYNYDDLILPLSGGVYETDELNGGPHSPEHKQIYFDMMLAGVASAVRNGKNVIVDDCHMTRASRRAFIDVANKERAESVFHYHALDTVWGLNRRQLEPRCTPNEVWIEVWKRFDGSWESISIDEGMDTLVTYDGWGNIISTIYKD